MGSSDRILIRDLHLRAIVGINEWEREKKQDVLIQLEVLGDQRAAASSDRVKDALNYRTLTKAVIAHVEASSYHLLEALAESIARIAVAEHGAEAVRVRVEKPGALRFAGSVGVEIERRRGDFG